MNLQLAEEMAHSKFPLKGKCKKSAFMNGWHRVGTVPVESLLDGGASGDILQVMCLDCGKFLTDNGNKRYFIIKNQPNKIKEASK